jgi:uncharacterized protein YceK
MQKLLKAILCCSILTFSGCTKNTTDAAAQEEYQTYYNTVSENVSFADAAKNFTCELEMTQVEDGTYRYYVVIDHPVSAMYNIITIAVENDIKYDDADKMMPSMGIFDDPKSMIPGQVDTKNGFVKGIALSGESSESKINLKLLVQWTDKAEKTTTREFIKYSLQADQVK